MANEINITFLGTSSAPPQLSRKQSAIVVKYKSHTLLFDVGEATQYQMIEQKIKFTKLTIILTHLHSDHTLGIMGLLTTRNFRNIKTPIKIIGPEWTSKFISLLFFAYRFKPDFDIEIIETSGGIVLENKDFLLESFPLSHSDTSFGYKLVTKPKIGRFNVEKASELNIPRGELWKKLQNGKVIEINGKAIHPSDVLDEVEDNSLKVIITGDTPFDETTVEYAQNADLLIHDATYPSYEEVRAKKYLHSTCTDAANVAKQAKVKRLIMTHISELHKNLEESLRDAKEIFSNCEFAEDGLKVKLKSKV
ncbi:MAG: Ribonuclease Z [Candidatus Heimdallarchaeota archaeon AB_125]|nr:MAG: Ribonuclease Z [Candidatus Heimdallarchaeota archaeon AB_125]